MVNEVLDFGPERTLALSYAPPARRGAIAALFALDDTLAEILRSTRDPMVGQMRLTWWHTALTALDDGPPPAQPVLQSLAAQLLPTGVNGAALTPIVEGWEELLGPDPLPDEALLAFARLRGGGLFAVGGTASSDPLAAAGTGWALIDLARHTRDPALAGRARTLAAPFLAKATASHWTRANRSFGALAHFARADGKGAITRVTRALWHRITGF